MESPSSVTVPRSGASRPAITRSNVDLPEPFGPMRATTWPPATSTSIPSRTGKRPPPRIGKANSTAVTRIAPGIRSRRPCRSGARAVQAPVHGIRPVVRRLVLGRGSSRRSMRVIARTPVRVRAGPDPDGSQDRRAEHRCLEDRRHQDRETGDVGLDLVPGLAAGRSPAGTHRCHRDAGGEHRFGHMPDGERARLEDRAAEVGAPVGQRQADERARGCRVPDGRAFAGQVRQEDDAVGAGREVAASSSSRSVVTPPPTTLSRNQSSARPVAAIAAPTLNRPSSGAGVTNAPGTSTGSCQYTPNPPAEPPGS